MIATSRDLQAHLDKVKSRIESEDLSAIELKVRYRETLEGSEGLSGNARKVKSAEAQMIMGMAHDAKAPPASVDEQVQTLRDQGKTDMADSLETTAKRNKLRAQIREKREQIAGLTNDDLGRQRTQNILKEIDELEKNAPINPYFERAALVKAEKKEHTQKLEQAQKMVDADLMTQDEYDVLEGGDNAA